MVRILIAEDAAPIRHVLVTWMQREGCHVLSAADGTAALGLLRGHPVDLLITDVVMPGLTGVELVQAAFGACPALRRAILITGYCDPQGLRQILHDPRVVVIPKPFRPSQLLAEVQRIAAGSGPDSADPWSVPPWPDPAGSSTGAGE